MLKKLGEGLLVPELPREARNLHPLINTGNGGRTTVAERHPRIKNKVEPFDKPMFVKPDVVFIRNRRKFKDPPIAKINILN